MPSSNSRAADAAVPVAVPVMEEEEPIDIEYTIRALTSLIFPVGLTMVCAGFLSAYVSVADNTRSEVGFNKYLAFGEDGGADESTASELGKAIVNALIIIGIVVGVTSLMLLLYYFRCTKVLIGQLILSSLMLLGLTTSFVILLALNQYKIAVDSISFYLFMYNFAFMGTLSIFFRGTQRVKGLFLVVISVVMAFLMTLLPEWTNWTMLIGLSLYDMCAVLSPCGPLKWLIQMSEDRNEAIPALLYEADIQRSPLEARPEQDGRAAVAALNGNDHRSLQKSSRLDAARGDIVEDQGSKHVLGDQGAIHLPPRRGSVSRGSYISIEYDDEFNPEVVDDVDERGRHLRPRSSVGSPNSGLSFNRGYEGEVSMAVIDNLEDGSIRHPQVPLPQNHAPDPAAAPPGRYDEDEECTSIRCAGVEVLPTNCDFVLKRIPSSWVWETLCFTVSSLAVLHFLVLLQLRVALLRFSWDLLLLCYIWRF